MYFSWIQNGMIKGLLLMAVALSGGALAETNTAAESAAADDASTITCEAILNSTKKEYIPTGYVSRNIIDAIAADHSLLFSEIYYRALGVALNEAGFKDVSNTKGAWHNKVSVEAETKVMDMANGQADRTVQIQGKVATAMWTYLYEKFRLGDPDFDESKAERYAKKAYFENRTDAFLQARKFLMEHIGQRRQIVEFFRLMLPFGTKMAINGTRSYKVRTWMKTGLVTVVTGAVSYFALKFAGLSWAPDPGMWPMLVSSGATLSAFSWMWIKLNPRAIPRSIQLKILHARNKKILEKKGLISEDGLEATALIDAAFLDRLQNEVNEEDIRKVVAIPPAKFDDETVERAMQIDGYGNDLDQMLSNVASFQRTFMEEWLKTTLEMGEPVAAFGRLLTFDEDGNPRQIPENMHLAVEKYHNMMPEVLDRLLEVRGEFRALADNYKVHAQILDAILQSRKSELSDRAYNFMAKRVQALRMGEQAATTQYLVAKQQSETLATEQEAISSALRAIAAVRGNQSMTADQRKEMVTAIINMLDAMEETEKAALQSSIVEATEEEAAAEKQEAEKAATQTAAKGA